MDIALLKCGDFAEKVHEQIGDDYSKVFKDWLQASLPNPLVNKFTLDSYDVVQDIYPRTYTTVSCSLALVLFPYIAHLSGPIFSLH